MSSSPEPRGAAPAAPATLTALATPQLRTGHWTRLGSGAVLGDPATEDAMESLAEATRAAARAQGYAVGWAEGRRAAAAEADAAASRAAAADEAERSRREAQMHDALDRLDACVRGLDTAASEASTILADRALGLARELTTILVGHELRIADTSADAVRRALELTAGEPTATVRLSPVDAAATQDGFAGQNLTVRVDPTLQPGDIVVETDEAVIDARIATALARVREALS